MQHRKSSYIHIRPTTPLYNTEWAQTYTRRLTPGWAQTHTSTRIPSTPIRSRRLFWLVTSSFPPTAHLWRPWCMRLPGQPWWWVMRRVCRKGFLLLYAQNACLHTKDEGAYGNQSMPQPQFIKYHLSPPSIPRTGNLHLMRVEWIADKKLCNACGPLLTRMRDSASVDSIKSVGLGG